MRLILPWTYVEPRVDSAIAATGWKREAPYVGLSDRAYFDLLASLWAAGDSFIICEQDIVPHPTAFDDLANCRHDWCAFPYEYVGHKTYGLGLVKFSAELIARHPDAMERVAVMRDPTHEPRHWCRLDAWLQGVILPLAGEVPHGHEPMVKHLGDGCAHGCTDH